MSTFHQSVTAQCCTLHAGRHQKHIEGMRTIIWQSMAEFNLRTIQLRRCFCSCTQCLQTWLVLAASAVRLQVSLTLGQRLHTKLK
jgi:hypothetical protein